MSISCLQLRILIPCAGHWGTPGDGKTVPGPQGPPRQVGEGRPCGVTVAVPSNEPARTITVRAVDPVPAAASKLRVRPGKEAT